MDILTQRQIVIQRLIDLTTGADLHEIEQRIKKLHRVAEIMELEKSGVSLVIPPILLHLNTEHAQAESFSS